MKHVVAIGLCTLVASSCSPDTMSGGPGDLGSGGNPADGSIGAGAGGGAAGAGGSAAAGGHTGSGGTTAGGDRSPLPSHLGFGAVDELTQVSTALPAADPFLSVDAYVEGDTLRVLPFPVEGAQDYRVYPLPEDSDVVDLGGGDFAIQDGTYRCAGHRYAPPVKNDSEPYSWNDGHTVVAGQVEGYARTEGEAMLGHVYLEPGPNRAPLFALGGAAVAADNACPNVHNQKWAASRVKRYTTSAALRDELVQAGWRDDGIIAYVPTAPSGNTQQVYERRDNRASAAGHPGTVLYFTEGPEHAQRSDAEASFLVLSAAGTDTQPLMRVFYNQIPCGGRHDELVVGRARFEVARHQGPVAFPKVAWPGVEGRTRYVVEALDAKCPYQGTIVTDANAAGTSQGVTRKEEGTIRSEAPYGELFINGQGDPTSRPRVLARAILEAEPHPNPVSLMPFNATFDDNSLLSGLEQTRNDYMIHEYENDQVQLSFLILDWYSLGVAHNELWVAFDEANSSNGKFRLTPKTEVTLEPDRFVHVTMSVDSFSSPRRYPQIIVTDNRVELPIQELGKQNLAQGAGLIVQPFWLWPSYIDIQLCNQRRWDVNDQCPPFDTSVTPDRSRFLPHPEVAEDLNLGWRNRYDVYVSTTRAYVFLDYQPLACVNLPGDGLQPGPGAHVTYGAVLYHSGAFPDVSDEAWYGFHREHMIHGTRRFFDDLGFEEGVPAPPWDESLFPCADQVN